MSKHSLLFGVQIRDEICSVFGNVMIVAVGATMVGSINICQPPTTEVKKGDINGYFTFGGSTVLLFFEPNTIVFDQDLIENSKKCVETLVKVNTRLGVSTHASSS